MKTVSLESLPKEIKDKITYWHVVADIDGQIVGVSSSYKINRCKNPQTALKRFKRYWGVEVGKERVKRILVRGLTVHAETKPLILEEI